MSEVAKPTEATSKPAVVGGTDSTPLPSTTPHVAGNETSPRTDTVMSALTNPTGAADVVNKDEAKAEDTPASESVLGYKGPGLLQ